MMKKKLIIFLITCARTGWLCRVVAHGIMGLLCRQHFPGIVTYASKTEPAYSFDHYAVASDAEYPNKAVRVKAEFWVSLPRTTLLNMPQSLDFS